jgi:putative flippase GtrA
MAFSLLALPVIVFLLRHYMSFDRQAPYLAGGIVIGVGVVFSFFGHKYFSFKPRS